MIEFIPATVIDPTPLQFLWFLLLGVLAIGYFVLDGFDLGIGALYPFIAKNEEEKAQLRRSIGPVWDGNEVWLLSAGGVLFAAFAPAYATTFSGFYLAIILVLLGLIARAISLEFRAHDTKWHGLYDGAFFLGSAVPALLFGVAIGNVIEGLPLNNIGDYVGIPLVGLLRPFPLACGLVGLVTMLAQGAAWTALKLPVGSEARERAIGMRKVFAIVTIVLFVVTTALFFLLANHNLVLGSVQSILAIVFAIVIIAGAVVAIQAKGQDNDLSSFIGISAIPVGLIGITAASLFPFLVPSIPESASLYPIIGTAGGPSLSVASAGGSDLALTAMTIIACIGVPLVLVYHVITYRTFRGRLTAEDLEY
jgi:cytochrome d ubiquinol oxidase subunit II